MTKKKEGTIALVLVFAVKLCKCLLSYARMPRSRQQDLWDSWKLETT